MRHNIRPFGEEKISALSFQDAVFKSQIFIEDLYIAKMQQISTDKQIVFLINRGLLDGKAFLQEEDFNKICRDNNYNIEDIKTRYDTIFCLETLAKLGVYNQHDNNEVRFQDMQGAIDMNDKFYQDYRKYYNDVYYFKANKIFENKYNEILNTALNCLLEFTKTTD